MRKFLFLALFLLNLLPAFVSGDAFSMSAQSLAYENGSWLPNINIDGKEKERCEVCGNYYDANDPASHECTTKCEYCLEEVRLADINTHMRQMHPNLDDNPVKNLCLVCGAELTEDEIKYHDCEGVPIRPGHSGGNSGGSGGGSIIIGGNSNGDSGNDNIGDDTGGWFDDAVDTLATPSHRTYTSEQELEFAKQLGKVIRNMIEKLEKAGKIQYSDKDVNCHYDPKSGSLILPANSDFTEGAVVHELIHYVQDKLGILNIKTCSADNEYQAYVINYIFMTAKGDKNYTFPQGIDDNKSWGDFQKSIKAYYKNTNGEVTYNQSLLNNLENLDHAELSGIFRSYWEAMDKDNEPKKHSVYYEAHDSNYNWNWEQILKSLGFKEMK